MQQAKSTLTYKEQLILQPLFRFGTICAISVPQIATQLKKPPWFIVYSVLVILMMTIFCIWAVLGKISRTETYPFTSVLIFDVTSSVILPLISIVNIVYGAFAKDGQIKKLLQDLMDLDFIMSDGLNFSRKRSKTILMELVFFHIFIWSLAFFDGYTNVMAFGWASYRYNLINILYLYVVTIQVLYISNYILSIKYKMVALNKSLVLVVKNLMKRNEARNLSIETTQGDDNTGSTVLNKFMETHYRLCSSVNLANDCFGLQILATLFVGVIYTTFMVFLVLLYGSAKEGPFKNNLPTSFLLLLYISNSLLYMIYAVLITVSCTGASEAGRKTAKICYQLLLNVDIAPPDNSPESHLRKDLTLFAEQVSQRSIKFNAGGFLVVDYNTLYSLFGSTVMNVIILLQFQKQGNV